MNWWNSSVKEPNKDALERARQRQANLTKPPGSLGRLEDIALQMASWQGNELPSINNVAIRVFAADHGVVEEGVSAFPQSVTVEMIRNFSNGGAAISVLAKYHNANFDVVNLGTAEPLPADISVTNLQFAKGTKNFSRCPAMDRSLLHAALACGRDQVPATVDLFIGGEMGIGNTSSAAALTSALLDLPTSVTVGRGTGVNDAMLEHKRSVISKSLLLHADQFSDAMDILRCLGGLEIAALCGAYISCAQRGIPILVDGYICTAAALLACRINSGVRAWMIFSHCSAEPGHQHLLSALDAQPLLDLGMRLGEGSGAAVALPLIHQACELHCKMATFVQAGVSEGG
ncbi:MAG: nicotinate-nucleotide--dimethylbenzimidazole phosphoribosyltransferase [Pseudomonadales bacterium]